MVKKLEKKKRSKVNIPQPVVSDKFLRNFRYVLLAALMVVIFYPPYLRGLYFETEQLPTEIFVFAIFAAFWIYKGLKRDNSFLKTPLDYASLALVFVYFVSIFVSVGVRESIAEWLKYCMYFAVFFMVSELASTYRSKLLIIWTIIASALGVCILGIDGAAGEYISKVLNGLFKVLGAQNDVFFGLFVSGRINSTLQYPNALASYLMAVFFVCVGITINTPKLWEKLLSAAAGFILLETFILTQSRGAYIMLPVILAVFLVVLPKGSRIKGAAFSITEVFITLVFSVWLLPYMSKIEDKAFGIWMLMIAGIAATVVSVFAMGYALKFLEKVNWKIYVGIISACIIFAGIGAVFVINADSPAELSNLDSDEDTRIAINKSQVLEANKEYKLVYHVDAVNSKNKAYAYQIRISSQNEKQILSGKSTLLTSYNEKDEKIEGTKEISFNVPEDSSMVNISFVNYYQGTKAVFDNVHIVDEKSGETVKKLILEYKYIPERFVSRFENIEANLSGLQRTIYYRDAAKMIKDRWILGSGGGTWPILYFAYQSFFYSSTQAHNYFLQVGVETGVLGLLIIGVLIAYIWIMFLILSKKKGLGSNERVLMASIFTSIVAMFGHAAMDFDLSLSAVFLVLWQFMALFNVLYREGISFETDDLNTEKKTSLVSTVIKNYIYTPAVSLINLKHIKLKSYIGLIAALLIISMPALLYAGYKTYSSAITTYNRNNDISGTIKYLKSAVELDWFSPEYKFNYANFLIRKSKPTQEDIETSKNIIEKLSKQNQQNPEIMNKLSQYYIFVREFEKGTEAVERAVSIRPFNPEQWEIRTEAYFQIAMYYFNKGENSNAMKYVDSALDTIDRAKKSNEKNLLPFILNKSNIQIIEKLKYIRDTINSMEELNIDKLAFYNIPAMDVNSDDMPDQWLVSNGEILNFEIKDGTMSVENTDTKISAYIQSRELSLQSGKTYRIEVKLADIENIKEIPYIVSGVSKKTEALKLQGNIYSGEMPVPNDFKPGNNFLRLYVKGKYEIKNVKILEK